MLPSLGRGSGLSGRRCGASGDATRSWVSVAIINCSGHLPAALPWLARADSTSRAAFFAHIVGIPRAGGPTGRPFSGQMPVEADCSCWVARPHDVF